MHRDMLVTNRDAVLRWIDAMSASLSELRADLASNSPDANEKLESFFTEARDARADWATQTTREGELLQATAAELSPESVSDHMGRMFLGGFAKKLRQPASRGTSPAKQP